MNRIITLASFLLISFSSFAQFVQFSQLPISLNPALSGSADAMRVTLGRDYLKETDPLRFSSDVTTLTSINADKYVPKIKCGIGLNVNTGDWKNNAFFNTNSYGFGMHKSNTMQIGLAIAPKFLLKSKKNPNLTHSVWSPALEVNYKFSRGNVSSIYAGQRTDEGVLKASALGFRIGITRVGKRSVLGFCYGYQKTLNSSGFTLQYNETIYDSLGNPMKSVPVSQDYRYGSYTNQSFLVHYGLSVNLNQSGTLSMNMQWLLSLSARSYNSASSAYVYNFYDYNAEIFNKDLLVQNLNFRYKKALLGFSINTGGYYGVTPYYSIGYQSKQAKIMATVGYLNHSKYGEITCGYVFK